MSNPEQLKIALEPEGAAIFCRERKMRDFTDENGDADVSDVFVRPGARYVMMDIGGNQSLKFLYRTLAQGSLLTSLRLYRRRPAVLYQSYKTRTVNWILKRH